MAPRWPFLVTCSHPTDKHQNSRGSRTLTRRCGILEHFQKTLQIRILLLISSILWHLMEYLSKSCRLATLEDWGIKYSKCFCRYRKNFIVILCPFDLIWWYTLPSITSLLIRCYREHHLHQSMLSTLGVIWLNPALVCVNWCNSKLHLWYLT